MPFDAFGAMNETEVRALYEYLKTRPARPYGER